jgi:hypothetical protein
MSQHKCPFKQGEEEPPVKSKKIYAIRKTVQKSMLLKRCPQKSFQFTNVLHIYKLCSILGEEGYGYGYAWNQANAS